MSNLPVEKSAIDFSSKYRTVGQINIACIIGVRVNIDDVGKMSRLLASTLIKIYKSKLFF